LRGSEPVIYSQAGQAQAESQENRILCILKRAQLLTRYQLLCSFVYSSSSFLALKILDHTINLSLIATDIKRKFFKDPTEKIRMEAISIVREVRLWKG
jgi:hypothetical protein